MLTCSHAHKRSKIRAFCSRLRNVDGPARQCGLIRARGRRPDDREEVITIGTETIVALVLGTATLVVAILSLVVKIIELSRH